jgi:CheY-like chemotaxis protein
MPDIIVMDLSLPGLDGWEATRRLKSDGRTKNTPVVALTGHAFTGSQKSAKDAGCDGYISKPCLPADLVAEIRRVLGGGRRKNP